MTPYTAVIYERDHEYARRATEAMTSGLKSHGFAVAVARKDVLIPAEIVVMWSVKWPNVIEHSRRVGRPYLVMETGYLGARLAEVSLGVNGLKRHAVPSVAYPARWRRAYRSLMKPWRPRADGPVVVMGQIQTDAAVQHVNLARWVEEAMTQIRSCGESPVYRRHPGRPTRSHPVDPIEDILREAKAVVTFNSNSGVDAVMAGVPTVACDDGSMAWDVSAHAITREALTSQPEPNREAWGAMLAGRQWTLDELGNGDAWAHMTPTIEAIAWTSTASA